jgi:cysteine-rich repeat protein
VAVAGALALIADDTNGLVILDVANPAAPGLLSTYNTPGEAYAVALWGNYAAVADGSFGVAVVNISNPMAPLLTATYNTAGTTRGIALAGFYPLLADGPTGLSVMGGLPALCQGKCGNTRLEAGEFCDDGNLTSGDGCNVTCTGP